MAHDVPIEGMLIPSRFDVPTGGYIPEPNVKPPSGGSNVTHTRLTAEITVKADKLVEALREARRAVDKLVQRLDLLERNIARSGH